MKKTVEVVIGAGCLMFFAAQAVIWVASMGILFFPLTHN